MDARIRMTSEDKRWIWAHAKHRTTTKLARGINDSVVKDDFVLLNAIGICGEVSWARWFGVPWYQNPGRGGDHHLPADLQLRTGVWCEVKTSRNPKKVKIPWTTVEEWDLVAFASFFKKSSMVGLVGIADRRAFAAHGELEERVDVQERKVESIVMDTKWLWPSVDLMRAGMTAPQPSGGAGLRCPWCGGTWPCKERGCIECLKRRQEVA